MNLLLLLIGAAATSFAQGVSVRTSELKFYTAPLAAEGALADQARMARASISADVHRLRAFVRAEEDTAGLEKILKAPAIAIVKVAALPLKGAKILLEAVTSGGSNPHGLVFISGQGASVAQTMQYVKPLVETSFRNLGTALLSAQLGASDALQMTCYLSSLNDADAIAELAGARFPNAALSIVQVPCRKIALLWNAKSLHERVKPRVFSIRKG
jgi:enamine deaminase RidA (YjgF/YER057c/UK114 family)